MRLNFFGGMSIDSTSGPIEVTGRGQQSLLFRLALDPGTTVLYRALAEDVWPDDLPEDPRASLQSLVSRLRRALPDGVLVAVPGGYRLAVDREDVDVVAFQDLAQAARRDDDVRAARSALDLWLGDPWIPNEGFDWLLRDLIADRGDVERTLRAAGGAATQSAPAAHGGGRPIPISAALAPIVGRQDELRLIADQVERSRLVTVLGPGGVGKTTLASEVARQRPAVLVELAPTTPDQVFAAVGSAVTAAIRISDAGAAPQSPRERVREALLGRHVLLVLDNCEHVSAAAAEMVLTVLGDVPDVRVLATSREPLGLPGEAFVDLGSLPEPDALTLFAHRVRAARGTEPGPLERDAVVSIVRQLDGLPLALELAGAKARTLTLEEIDAGLVDRFALLASGPRAAEPRHRTLRALVDWSWETLEEDERAALLAAATYPDGFVALDAPVVAAHACTRPDAFERLVERSLLHRAEGRYRMLETVRAYGLTTLGERGEEEVVRHRQASAMAELALRRDAEVRGRGARTALAWFDTNEDNLAAALRTAVDADDRELGTRLVRSMFWVWLMRERVRDLQAALAWCADPAQSLTSEAATVVVGAALVMEVVGAEPEAAPLLADADELAAAVDRVVAAAHDHPSELTAALARLLPSGVRAVQQLDVDRPWSWSFNLDVDDLDTVPEWTRALLWMLRSAVAQNNGDEAVLGVESERALDAFQRLGDPWGIAFASQMRSEWLLLHDRLTEALEVSDMATDVLAGLTSTADELQQRDLSVRALARLGRLAQARERSTQIMEIAVADGSQRALLQAYGTGAGLEVSTGDGAAALRLLDATPTAADRGRHAQVDAWLASLRSRALLLLDDVEEARSVVVAAVHAAIASSDRPIIADAALTLAGWFAARDEVDSGWRALELSVRLAGGVQRSDPWFQRVCAGLGRDPAAVPGGAGLPGAGGDDAALELVALADRLSPQD